MPDNVPWLELLKILGTNGIVLFAFYLAAIYMNATIRHMNELHSENANRFDKQASRHKEEVEGITKGFTTELRRFDDSLKQIVHKLESVAYFLATQGYQPPSSKTDVAVAPQLEDKSHD